MSVILLFGQQRIYPLKQLPLIPDFGINHAYLSLNISFSITCSLNLSIKNTLHLTITLVIHPICMSIFSDTIYIIMHNKLTTQWTIKIR